MSLQLLSLRSALLCYKSHVDITGRLLTETLWPAQNQKCPRECSGSSSEYSGQHLVTKFCFLGMKG